MLGIPRPKHIMNGLLQFFKISFDFTSNKKSTVVSATRRLPHAKPQQTKANPKPGTLNERDVILAQSS